MISIEVTRAESLGSRMFQRLLKPCDGKYQTKGSIGNQIMADQPKRLAQ
jgi:hypothetical protein